jgi:hypothetical protein
VRPFAPATPAGLSVRVAVASIFIVSFMALLLGVKVASSFAAEHTEVTAEYGKEGPASTGLGEGCHIAYNSAEEHLYLAGGGSRIYGLGISSPTATPLGGNFPINTGIRTECGDPQIAVDTSGSGNIYGVASTGKIYAWKPSGAPLGGNWPVTIPGEGETCGVDVTGNGEVWAGNFSQSKIFKYTAAGTPNGTLSPGFNVCKLVIDRANEDLFVPTYGGGHIFKFTASSGYSEKIEFPEAGASEPGLAINGAEGKLYVGTGGETVNVYDTGTGGLIETVNLGGSGGFGLAVDEGTDTLFATVGNGESGTIKEWLGVITPKAITGEPVGNSKVSGIANPNGVGPITECYFEFALASAATFEPTHPACEEPTPIAAEETVHATLPGLVGEETYKYRLVVSNGQPHGTNKGPTKTITPHNVKGLLTQPATEVTQESAVLNATFEGNGEDTHYYFEWGQTTNYGHRTATPPGLDAGSPTVLTPLSAAIGGLTPGVTYHYRVVGENGIGESRAADKSFKAAELPSIDSATAIHISETSAEIDATINPHEFQTEYFVEYGPTVDYGEVAPIPSGVLPAGNAAQDVAIQLTDLTGIPYHFRVVASSRWGTVRTEDQSFNFYPDACPNSRVREQNESQYLPDCRSYELVSPEETGNVELLNTEFTPSSFATNPPRFAFVGELGGIKGAGEATNSGGDIYISTRTNTGWKTKLVGLRGYEGQEAGPLFANSNFTKFLDYDEPAFFPGQPQPPHHVPYLWDDEGNPVERWPTNWESFPGAEESNGAQQPSPDLTHYAFSSTNVRFAAEGLTSAPGSAYDYNAITHTTSLISKTANGEDIQQEPGNVSQTEEAILFPGVTSVPGEYGYGKMAPPMHPGVSTDGSHILMSTASHPYDHFTEPPSPTRLYMRVDDAVTYEVSRRHDVNFVAMSPDGAKVFFTSPERLTPEDTDNSIDLYMWSEAGDTLTLISKAGAGAEGTGNSDSCIASWIEKCGVKAVKGEGLSDNTISAENSEIYFYSPEQLEGARGVPNQVNLYVYRGGKAQFVTTLQPTGGENGPITRMQISPNGNHAAFLTASRVTSYDNAGFQEMYSYEPAERKIVCVSCKPDGKAPTVDVVASKMGLFMSNDGRTFFSTEDALVPSDSNEQIDVYEYVEGRPQLITTGTGTSQSKLGGFGGSGNKGQEGLAGVSADGVNVYFSVRDPLVPQNKNGPFLAFYDARTNGGFPYVPPLAPCEAADECHGEGSSAPAAPSIASEADMGNRGNAANPPKKKQHKKKHHKKKGKHKSKQAKKKQKAGSAANSKGKH